MKKQSLKDSDKTGHRRRLRERFRNAGRKALADYELIELLLTYAIPRVDTKPVAKALLKQFKTIFNVLQQPPERLMDTKGIGIEAATYISLIQACLTQAVEKTVDHGEMVSGPEDLLAYARMALGPSSQECLYVLYLDDARHVVHHQEAARGTVDRLSVYPREVIKPALVHNATALILVHNHPDGQPVPSENDLDWTAKIEKLATMFDIKLLDHLIVTKLQAYSIKTGKLL
jgi:DNA repair protein RadC